MKATVRPVPRLRGQIEVPGDKSISHRAAIFNALAEGTSVVRGFLQGEDCLSTVNCLRQLGVQMDLDESSGALTIRGAGLRGLREPSQVLDAGNSGTTMRLLCGVLAGQPSFSVITGDQSLRERPMERVLAPLRQMGASAWAREGGRAPVAIHGGDLRGMRYQMPVASAQVKSALILAGLFAEGETVLDDVGHSRDHTERMLNAMGAQILSDGLTHRVSPLERLVANDVSVPGDMSAAAFWIAAAAAHPDADIVLKAVGVNPTRTGLIEALEAMGAEISVTEQRFNSGEPIAEITVRSSGLRGIEVDGELTLRLVDEVPALAIAAALAEGRTVIRDAADLRVKESDRIATVARMLKAFGVEVQEQPDGMIIEGSGRLSGAQLDCEGDHRLAMASAIGGLIAEGETIIERSEAVDVSYPGFWRDLEAISGATLVTR